MSNMNRFQIDAVSALIDQGQLGEFTLAQIGQRVDTLGRIPNAERPRIADTFLRSDRLYIAQRLMDRERFENLTTNPKWGNPRRPSEPKRWGAQEAPVIVACLEAYTSTVFVRQGQQQQQQKAKPKPRPKPKKEAPKDMPKDETKPAPEGVDVPAVAEALGIADYLRDQSRVIEASARKAVADAMQDVKTVRIEWNFDKSKIVREPGEVTHEAYEDTMRAVAAIRGGHVRQALYLSGPKGCGKTYMVKQIAKKLGCPYYEVPGGPAAEWHHFVGQHLLIANEDGVGETVFVPGPLVEAARNGGIILVDEADRILGECTISMNGVLSSWTLAIPELGEIIECHPEFVFIATGNTRMGGATREYSTGQMQDSSFIDRFAAGFIEMDYDEKMEDAMGIDKRVIKAVRDLRKRVKEKNILNEEGVMLDVGTRFVTGAVNRMVMFGEGPGEAVANCTAPWSDAVRERAGLPARKTYGAVA